MARLCPADFKVKLIALCREHNYAIQPKDDCEAGLILVDAGDPKDRFHDHTFSDLETMTT